MLQKITVLLLLSLVFTSCWEATVEKKIIKSYSTYTVTTGSIASSEKYIGYTAWKTEMMLASKVPWRVTYLKKSEWDRVKKWELIAELDGAEAKTGYKNAEKIVGSLYGFKKQTSQAYDGQIAALRSKIQQVKVGIKWVKTGLEDVKKITSSQLKTATTGINQAKLGLETAKLNLEETQKTLDSQNKKIVSGGKSAIIQSVILYKNIIDFSDKFLGITKNNKKYNDKFEDYLGTKNSKHLKKTEELFLSTKVIFDSYQKFYLEKIEDKDPSKQEIINGLTLAERVAEKEKILLKELYSVIDNSIENIYFSKLVMDEYQKNISLLGSQVEASLLSIDWWVSLWIKGSLENFRNFDAEENKWISLLEKQVDLARASVVAAETAYEQYKVTANGKIHEVDTKKEVTTAQLAEVQAGIKALQSKKQASLKEIDAKIAEANGGKETAWVMIDNGKIYAHSSWIIVAKMVEEWQVVNAGMPLYSVADNSMLKVKISVNLETYRYLKKWKVLNISLSGTKYKTQWKVVTLATSAHKFTKKYDIELEMKNPKGVIPLGAMVEVFIKTQAQSSKKKVDAKAIIPNTAIISKFMLPSVYVLHENKAVLTPIKVIKMGEEKSEVEWLTSLDIIVVDWKENISDGEFLEIK